MEWQLHSSSFSADSRPLFYKSKLNLLQNVIIGKSIRWAGGSARSESYYCEIVAGRLCGMVPDVREYEPYVDVCVCMSYWSVAALTREQQGSASRWSQCDILWVFSLNVPKSDSQAIWPYKRPSFLHLTLSPSVSPTLAFYSWFISPLHSFQIHISLQLSPSLPQSPCRHHLSASCIHLSFQMLLFALTLLATLLCFFKNNPLSTTLYTFSLLSFIHSKAHSDICCFQSVSL